MFGRKFCKSRIEKVKRDKSGKFALDAKNRNDAINTNKYQLQSIDHLIDELAMYISERQNEKSQFSFSEISPKYAYSQNHLDKYIQKHYNFSILGGRATGAYCFVNVFYGLTDKPATFEEMIDKILENIISNFAFLEDILNKRKGFLEHHEVEFGKVLK